MGVIFFLSLFFFQTSDGEVAGHSFADFFLFWTFAFVSFDW